MRAFSTPKVWITIIALFALVALFFIPLPWQTDDRFWNAVSSWFHFPLFAAIAYLLCILVGPTEGSKGVIVWLSCGALAVVVEWIQPFVGRSFHWGDAVQGVLGSSTVVASVFWAKYRLRIIGLAVLISLLPISGIIGDRLYQRLQFPVLAAFELPLEAGRWNWQGVTLSRSLHGRKAVWRIDADYSYPGAFMRDFSRDWSEAQKLQITYSLEASEPLHGWIRIDDRMNPSYVDRFQTEVSWSPGSQVLELEVDGLRAANGRSMNLQSIVRWGVFFAESSAERTIQIHRVELVMGQVSP